MNNMIIFYFAYMQQLLLFSISKHSGLFYGNFQKIHRDVDVFE
jgi:hypothetical protein